MSSDRAITKIEPNSWNPFGTITDSEALRINQGLSEQVAWRRAEKEKRSFDSFDYLPAYEIEPPEDARIEDPELYLPGGWHPVDIGSRLDHGRYKIILKINHGSYSTIWLAVDRDGRPDRRYVVLKVNLAMNEDDYESRIVDYVKCQLDRNDPGSRAIQTVHRSFVEEGPNGNHLCLVLEPLNCSLAELHRHQDVLTLPVARAIIAQLILGLKSIHSCGVAHGDIHPGNIAFEMEPLSHLTVSQVYQKLGQPEKIKLYRRRSEESLGPEAPRYLYSARRAAVSARNFQLRDSAAVFIDFGESWAVGDNDKESLNSPPMYRAPESPWYPPSIGQQSDVWSLACCMWDILFDQRLFHGGFHWKETEFLSKQVELVGGLPSHWGNNAEDTLHQRNSPQHDQDDIPPATADAEFESPPLTSSSLDPPWASEGSPPAVKHATVDQVTNGYITETPDSSSPVGEQVLPRESHQSRYNECPASPSCDKQRVPELPERFSSSVKSRNETMSARGEEVLAEEEAKAMLEMLSSMLVFDTESRATSLQLSHCEWMRKWGYKALEDLEKVRPRPFYSDDVLPAPKRRKGAGGIILRDTSDVERSATWVRQWAIDAWRRRECVVQ